MTDRLEGAMDRWDEVKKALEEREILGGDKYPEMLQVVASLTLASVLEDILAELKTIRR